MNNKINNYLYFALRILLGWIFLWPFLDKLLGLGLATAPERAWIRGGSPTTGFLANSPTGPFAPIFNAMAGSTIVDVLFMAGLLCIGVALIAGRFLKLAGFSGALLLFLMWLAVLPPSHNPIVDDHIVYGTMLILIALDNNRFRLKKT